MTRTTNTLGFLAAALLFLAMFAGLFGAYGSTAPERQCWNCGRSGHWWGVTLPSLRSGGVKREDDEQGLRRLAE